LHSFIYGLCKGYLLVIGEASQYHSCQWQRDENATVNSENRKDRSMDFGTQMKDLRKKNNMTQEQMADKLGVSRQAISNWENNKNLPDIEMVIKISQIFSVSLDELILGGNDEMNNMTEQLIEDGSDSRKMKTAVKVIITGAVLMLIGFLCFVLKGMTVEYIDAEGILHENFFFIPIGFMFLFIGAAVTVVGVVKACASKKKKKNRS
jgi:transcriptional regulator with XRE-family HTH domain